MNAKEWNEGLNNVDPDLVEEYVAQKDEYSLKKKNKKPYWFVAVAAVLVLAIGIGSLFGGNRPLPANQVAAAEYPKMAQKPNYDDYQSNYDAYSKAYEVWQKGQSQQYDQPDGYADSLTDFFYASMAQFLQGKGNPTYSPLNVYMAMAMLAETTGGNSIITVMGVPNMRRCGNRHLMFGTPITVMMARPHCCWQIRYGWMMRILLSSKQHNCWLIVISHRHSVVTWELKS